MDYRPDYFNTHSFKIPQLPLWGTPAGRSSNLAVGEAVFSRLIFTPNHQTQPVPSHTNTSSRIIYIVSNQSSGGFCLGFPPTDLCWEFRGSLVPRILFYPCCSVWPPAPINTLCKTSLSCLLPTHMLSRISLVWGGSHGQCHHGLPLQAHRPSQQADA